MTTARTTAVVDGGVLRLLRDADAVVCGHLGGRPRTLDPLREWASSFEEIGERLLGAEVPVALGWALARSMLRVAESVVEHFPETIFWDLDFLASALLGRADAQAIAASTDRIVGLQEQYGRHSVIRFRYVHDFLYGFDWAKWVIKSPGERGGVKPFDDAFLVYLATRGQELVELIGADDVTYPKLPDGRPRNPFGFSREPVDEGRLHVDLSAAGLVPLAAWQVEALASWDRPYARLREERARALGIGLVGAAGLRGGR